MQRISGFQIPDNPLVSKRVFETIRVSFISIEEIISRSLHLLSHLNLKTHLFIFQSSISYKMRDTNKVWWLWRYDGPYTAQVFVEFVNAEAGNNLSLQLLFRISSTSINNDCISQLTLTPSIYVITHIQALGSTVTVASRLIPTVCCWLFECSLTKYFY